MLGRVWPSVDTEGVRCVPKTVSALPSDLSELRCNEENWRGLGHCLQTPCPPPPGSPSCLLAPMQGALRGFHLEMRFRGRVYGPSTASVRVFACAHVVCVYMLCVCGHVCMLRGGFGACPARCPSWPFRPDVPDLRRQPPGIPRNDSSRQPPSMKAESQVPQ